MPLVLTRSVRRAPRAIVVARHAAPIARVGGRSRRLAALAGRGLARARIAAAEEKHTIAAVGAAAALGYVEAKGVELPYITTLGLAGTYGLAAWAAGRYMRSKTLSHVATGLLSCAVRDLVKGWAD